LVHNILDVWRSNLIFANTGDIMLSSQTLFYVALGLLAASLIVIVGLMIFYGMLNVNVGAV
jgi:hypothetical protein